jgi:predicted phage tail component-like protein
MMNQGYAINYNGVSSSTIPAFVCETIERQLIGKRRHQFEEIPGMPGAWLFPEQAGLREITIHAYVLSDQWPTGRRDALKDVATWLETTAFSKLILGDDPTVYNMAVLSEAPVPVEWRGLGTFDLVFEALPYTYDLAVTHQTDTKTPATQTITVVNNGDVPTDFILTVTPAVNATSVVVSANGKTLTVAQPVTHAGQLTINGIAKVVETGPITDTDLQGIINPAKLAMANVSGNFPQLKVGSNNITITVTGDTGYTSDLYFRNQYR